MHNPLSKTENSQMASVGAIFSYTHHTKQQNPWLTSPASRVVIYRWLPTCPGEMKPFKHRPSTHGCLTSFKNKLPKFLVNVYNYCLMIKRVVHGSWLFSNPVT